MDIGKQIKYYRTQKKVKQEELADYLGVSFQAVSKWENGASTPDIGLLPQIAVYFGITIDELFKMPDEEQFLRIENMAYREEEIEPHTFAYFENFLLSMAQKKEKKERAYVDLALLYNQRALASHKLASQYAKEAFELNPDNKDAWVWYLEANNGVSGDDWYDNHFEVISYFKDFLKRHPDNFLALYGLIENLLVDDEFDEALPYIEQLEKCCKEKRQYMVIQYYGDVAYGKGETEKALELWKKGTQIEPKQWQAFCKMGDRLRKLGRYEEALKYYEECFAMQERPRISDGLYSIAQIEEKLGHYEKAIEAHERILDSLKEDYEVTKGPEVNEQKKEIARLKKLFDNPQKV
ncbi:MAG: helix-turn-helix domain-containing protein [Roseburia sp.]